MYGKLWIISSIIDVPTVGNNSMVLSVESSFFIYIIYYKPNKIKKL